MSLRRLSAAFALSFLGGCTLLSGAADLTTGSVGNGSSGGVDPGDSDGAVDPNREGGAGSPDGMSTTLPDGAPLPIDGATPAPLFLAWTFESGSLTGKNGGNTASGMPGCIMNMPIAGSYSMATTMGSSIVTSSFAGQSSLYATLLVEIGSFPDNDSTVIPILRFSASTAPPNGVGAVDFGVDRAGFHLVVGPADSGIGPMLEIAKVYRVGISVKVVGTQISVDSQVVAGAGAPFDPAKFAHSSLPGGVAIDQVSLGTIGVRNLVAEYDNLLISTTAFPAP